MTSGKMRLRNTLKTVAGLLVLIGCARAEPDFQEIEGHGGVPLTVMTAGDPANPGILFIHGFGQSSLAFIRQFESDLARRFHLVAYDMRGHGNSGKPWSSDAYRTSRIWADDVAAVIEATGLDKPVLVGWSYGGFVAMDYVRHYGLDAVSGINLLGSLGGIVPRPPLADTEWGRRMRENSMMSRSLDPRENIAAARTTAESFYTHTMTEQERTEQFLVGVMMPAYVRRAMGGRDLDNTDLTGSLAVPVMITRGTEDPFVPDDQVDAALEALPDATECRYDATGHLPFFADPERYNDELAAFVATGMACE